MTKLARELCEKVGTKYDPADWHSEEESERRFLMTVNACLRSPPVPQKSKKPKPEK